MRCHMGVFPQNCNANNHVSPLVLPVMVYVIILLIPRGYARLTMMTRFATVLNTAKNVKGRASYNIHLVI